jgi:UDP-galactopyranose mutase
MSGTPDVIVVGAGFAGAVSARILADAGLQVLVVDRRDHIGGNAFDEIDEWGILVHRYGPHLFHTNSQRVFDWLSQFTEWRKYEHRVLAKVSGLLVPIPINRTTINKLYGLDLDEAAVSAFLERVREPRDPILTSEDVVLSSVGRDLCEKFFRGYTRKQWGLDLAELTAGVAARIPTRTNDDDRYFTDEFQVMPLHGYTQMFKKMLYHKNIKIELGTNYESLRGSVPCRHTVFTGPIDSYFNYRFGKLPYRSLKFQHEHLETAEWFQPVGTVNFPNEYEFTRITEFKHATGQKHPGTSIVREFPCSAGDPYYPIPRKENEERFQLYKSCAREIKNVSFVGRLAQYRYYNMDQVVAAAMKSAEKIKEELLG